MHKSKYFGPSERQCRCNCGMDLQMGFIKRLDELRETVGFALPISSGARCPTHNAAVDGAKASKHIEGIAVDIRVIKMTNDQKYTLLKAVLAAGFTVGVRADILHIDSRPGNPLWFTYSA